MLCEDSIEVEKELSSVTDDNQDVKMKLKAFVSSKKITVEASFGEEDMISTSERGPSAKPDALTADAKRLEDEASNILSLVSAGVKNGFGQPGFVKWNRNFPVIETSPFDVIPGNILD